MPKTARYTLTWSPEQQGYELYEGQGIRNIVSEGSASWAWIDQVSSFAFHGKNGSYTVCKERKQRGEGYWYAYARVRGKMCKRYLGRSIDLTLSRLERIAHELWHNASDSPGQKAPDRVDRKSQRMLANLPVDPLLATKFYIPRLRPHLLHRSHLIQRLQQGLEHTLILLSAPVGFGKSTLLADWLTTNAIPAAWLSIDLQDNEPTRFLSYLFATLQIENPYLYKGGQFCPSSLETMLTPLINNLLARKVSPQEHFVLVLDNYQVITDTSAHRALTFLLKHLPPWMHLVLATREDPPLQLALLRARGDVLEIRAADLRFTLEEATAFLINVMGLPLSREESALLHARTEGWITGLQLAALSLQDRTASERFIMAFSGSHHYVVDYLLEEVLSRQSEAVQQFLLHTCMLDRLCAPLCDAVREEGGSQALLDFLERANLFLVPLDSEGRWYRYHRLFAEALRQRLQQTAPELVPELQQRASRWYEQQRRSFEKPSSTVPTSAPSSVPSAEPLTAREREVLQLLLDGASNWEIARALVLSKNTVKKHVLNICRKLNVRSRAQVIAKMRTARADEL
jgi:LuxR family transcriptional regulator, maltose regulon positive regulatory protein